jgi:hypothetical protein
VAVAQVLDGALEEHLSVARLLLLRLGLRHARLELQAARAHLAKAVRPLVGAVAKARGEQVRLGRRAHLDAHRGGAVGHEVDARALHLVLAVRGHVDAVEGQLVEGRVDRAPLRVRFLFDQLDPARHHPEQRRGAEPALRVELGQHRVEGEKQRPGIAAIGPPTHSFTPRSGSAASHWQYSGENQVCPAPTGAFRTTRPRAGRCRTRPASSR